MPLVKVELLKGKSPEYKRAILDGIHHALMDCFKVPEDDRIQRLYELDADSFVFEAGKTPDFILIELTVFKGRSLDAKRALYKAIADNLQEALGIKRTDVLIVLNEQPLDNWGVRGGIPASEAELRANLNV
jgi:phenylpyruvate tautomerase PptA (4-oxalocrotonate tautomerase family)